jgi:uncharacterized membrane protein YccC
VAAPCPADTPNDLNKQARRGGIRLKTKLKGAHRTLGTLLGLVASIGVAEHTGGHTLLILVLIVACMFCGFYMLSTSYAYLIFFLTIALGQLYSVLHEFSPGLMVLRLETAIGAVIGLLVAFLVSPLSTRETPAGSSPRR